MIEEPLTSGEREALLAAARQGLDRAYAPYSGIRVGAAVLTAQGLMVAAGNLENASLGLTLCAERAAIAAAAAAEGGLALRLRAVAVVSDRPGPFPPCGACRQVIAEFGPGAVIFYPGESGLVEAGLGQLLPASFQLAAGRT